MKTSLVLGIGALGLGALALAVRSDNAGALTGSPATLARMGQVSVDSTDLGELLELGGGGTAAEPAPPLSALASAVREEALRKTLLAQAHAAGVDRRADVAARARRAHEQVIVETWLAEHAAPAPDYPPETLARAYYDANRAAFATPARYRLAQIWLARPARDEDLADARAKAQRIAREAGAADADFAALAATHSQHAHSAPRGGALGWVSEARIRPELRDVVAGLDPGAVSTAVELDDGWHIVRLEAREAARTLDFAEARPRIEATLRAEQAAVSRAAYIETLVRDTPITVDEIALQEFAASRGGTPASP